MTSTHSAFLSFLPQTFPLRLPAGRASSLLYYGAWDLRFLALLGAD
jgi:hypothetical protein